MIFAQPGETFEAVVSNAPPKLAGTMAVRLMKNSDSATVIARKTSGITEILAESGVYRVALVAPLAADRYTVLWDDGTVSQETVSVEELVVAATPQIGAFPTGTGTAVLSLVEQVLGEGGFDATQPQVLGWLDQRHRLMCSRTKCFRKLLGLGDTVAEQESYALPDEVQEIHEVLVASATAAALGVPYGSGRTADLAQGALGYLWLGGLYQGVGGGIYTRDYDGVGANKIALFPTPTEGGLAITLRAVCRPAPLELGNRVVTPPEFDDALVEGAIATGLRREEARPDLATVSEQVFAAACGELLGQVNRRYRGSGPATIRVRGINA